MHRPTADISEKGVSLTFLATTLMIIAVCGITYELIIGTASSYLLGNSVLQFSITIGLFMTSFGIGSFLSTKIRTKLLEKFVSIEIAIGAIGGISVIALFSTYAYTSVYRPVMYLFILSIGTMIGLEIPLLIRLADEYNSNLRVTLGNMLGFDYIGALLGSVAFPLILLPHLGLIKTSILIGIANVGVALACAFKYKRQMSKVRLLSLLCVLSTILLTAAYLWSEPVENYIEQRLYRYPIILRKQSPYQRIVLTKAKKDVRLFLDGNIQFSSTDEYRYHEALVHPGMSLSLSRKNILILGGGDGLALREILKYPDVESVTLVDIDKDVVEICRTHRLISDLNEGVLEDRRVRIVQQDAYQFLRTTPDLYGFIAVDLPDPNNESVNKLYSRHFYFMLREHIEEGGFASLQSTSPFFAREAFWCINKTIESCGLIVRPYHLNVPSFGDWGFNLASRTDFNIDDIRITVPTKFLNTETVFSMFGFGKDIDSVETELNTLIKPALLSYYEKAWRHW